MSEKKYFIFLMLLFFSFSTLGNYDWRDLVAAKGAERLKALIAENNNKAPGERNYYFELPFTDDFLECEGGQYFKQYRSKLPNINIGDAGNPGFANCYLYSSELTRVNSILSQINSRTPRDADVYTFAVYGIPVYFLNNKFNDTTAITSAATESFFTQTYNAAHEYVPKMNKIEQVISSGFQPVVITDPKNNEQVVEKAYSDAEYIIYKIVQLVMQPGKNLYLAGQLKYDAYNTLPNEGENTQPQLSYDNLYITKSYGNFPNTELFNDIYKTVAKSNPMSNYSGSPADRFIRMVDILNTVQNQYYEAKQFITNVEAQVANIITCINSRTGAGTVLVQQKYHCFHDDFLADDYTPITNGGGYPAFVKNLAALNPSSFKFISMDTRVKLLKLLLMFVDYTPQQAIAEREQRLVVHLLTNIGTQPSDALSLLTALKQPNELYAVLPGSNPRILYLIMKGLYDADEMSRLDENYLFNAMAAISRLILQSKNANEEHLTKDLFEDNTTPDYVKHIKWSDYYTGIRTLFKRGREQGDRHYSVAFSTDNSLKVKAWENTWKPSSGGSYMSSPTTGIPTSSTSGGSYEDVLLGEYNFPDPFQLVYFSNTSKLELLAAAESGLNIAQDKARLMMDEINSKENYVHVAPAVFLEYARQKRSIDNSAANTRIFLDGIAIVLPLARIGQLGYLAKWARALIVGTDIVNAARATIDIAMVSGALGNNPAFTRLIHKIDQYIIALNLLSFGTDIAALKNIKYFTPAHRENIYAYFQEFNKDDVLAEVNRILTQGAEQEKKAVVSLLYNGDKAAVRMEEAFGANWMANMVMPPHPTAGSAFDALNDAYFSRVVTGNTSTQFFSKGSNGAMMAEHVNAGNKLLVKNFSSLTNDIRSCKLVASTKYYKQVNNSWQEVTDGAFVLASKNNGTSCLIEGLCFTGSTLVATEEGLRPISEIKQGDLVYTMNFELNKPVLSPVAALIQQRTAQLMRIVARGDTVYCTPSHPFYTVEDGWKAAGELQKGWQVFTLSGTSTMITGIEQVITDVTVYNFEVADNHNYFVGRTGLLAHNTFVCDDYIAAVATRLGLEYNAVETIVRGLEEKMLSLKGTYHLTKEQVIERIRKLADMKIGRPRAVAFFNALKEKPQLSTDFAHKVLKHEKFMDEILEEPRRLEAWVKLKSVTNEDELAAWAKAYKEEGTVPSGSMVDISYNWKTVRILYFEKGKKFEEAVVNLIRAKDAKIITPLAQKFGMSNEEFVNRYVIFPQTQKYIPKAGAETGFTDSYTIADLLIGKRKLNANNVLIDEIESYYNFEIKLSSLSPSTQRQVEAVTVATNDPNKLFKVRSERKADILGSGLFLDKGKEIKITQFYKITGDGKGAVNGAIGNISIN